MRKSIAGVVAAAAFALVGSALAQALETKTSTERGVTVKVTPKNLAAGTAAWEFSIVLDTHSGSLSDDLAESAVLLDAAGGRHAPLAWEGAPPGGHHREGLLRFKPLTQPPQEIELQIAREGEPAPRIFRWPLR